MSIRLSIISENAAEHCHCEIFSEVEPDPSIETIQRGVHSMNVFAPDVIIALGGGSAIDAAKGMWLFYENPVRISAVCA